MNLSKEILMWDGKSADSITYIFKKYSKKSLFEKDLIDLISSEDTDKGASWLLKKWLESGNNLAEKDVKNLCGKLLELQNWETKLHILQSLPYLDFNKSECLTIYAFLKSSLTNSNKFVRAWTYNGFYELAARFPEYTEETKKYFDMAMKDEAASVKARIRKILKRGF
ncbi:hypothetical protein [Agarilytica rhodophyticola]|uniref:hypothetical protein n=1 Tax=Agarilytica rhodophyticola TaxID=1737490 RepID=UPI000B344AB0|nr:hypothetical protein [Agarilytica rhodophyticola]